MIVLIVGGTGTLAQAMIPLLLKNPQIERLRLLSRGEHAQTLLQEKLGDLKERVDFFVGDCRDEARIKKASEHCQQVFHFAAMKSIDKAEYDPWEAVQTNIQGTKNVIEACLKNQVEKAIFTSTDKAVSAINCYGATKLVAEKLWIQANIGKHRTRFSVGRFGNMLGSNGSVFHKWKRQLEQGKALSITHEEMTRFFLLPSEAAEFILRSIETMRGGEVFIPKMKSSSMLVLAKAFQEWFTKEQESLDLTSVDWMGLRPGEKMDECLISPDEVDLITEEDTQFIRWPEMNLFAHQKRGEPLLMDPKFMKQKGFTSKLAERFTIEELKGMIEWQMSV